MTTAVRPSDHVAAMGFIQETLERELAAANWTIVALRDRLAAAGLDASAPSHVMTADRVRALENVLDLARLACRQPTARRLADLRDACVTAGRKP